ncbi:FxsA family protein [Helicobacter sp. 23-1044]
MRFLIFLAYIAIEIYLVAEVIDEWGFLAFILEIILSAVLGVGILGAQFGRVGENLRKIAEFRLSVGGFLGRSIFCALGAILLIIPAILSDIFGVLFLIISIFFKNAESSNNFNAESNNFSDFRNFNAESRHFSAESANFRAEQSDEIIEAEIIEHKEKLK